MNKLVFPKFFLKYLKSIQKLIFFLSFPLGAICDGKSLTVIYPTDVSEYGYSQIYYYLRYIICDVKKTHKKYPIDASEFVPKPVYAISDATYRSHSAKIL